MTQSIIVYRNPAEAHFWESGIAFPLMTALFVFFMVAMTIGHSIEKVSYRKRLMLLRYSTAIIFIPASAAGILTFLLL